VTGPRRARGRRRRAAAVLLAAALTAAACGDDGSTQSTAAGTAGSPAPTTSAAGAPATASATGAPATTATGSGAPATAAPTSTKAGTRCIVSFHGNGGGGQRTWTDNQGIVRLFPEGNARGWGNGRQWLYETEGDYAAAKAVVAKTLADNKCTRATFYGFSNGAAFAAKLYCKAENFGITIAGVIIDDPVVDAAVRGCARPAGVNVVLYWTGDIDVPAGWDCRANNWTCEGGASIGIAAYESALGVQRRASIHTKHLQYIDPPELLAWI
jgi:hypothetical protein